MAALCECGCGGVAPIASRTRSSRGIKKGDQLRFIKNHNIHESRYKFPVKSGEDHPAWKGGRITTQKGYIKIQRPKHHRADGSGYVFEHILVAEKMYGGALPRGAEVHHNNRLRHDNSPKNLTICKDHDEHMRIHKQDAIEMRWFREQVRKRGAPLIARPSLYKV